MSYRIGLIRIGLILLALGLLVGHLAGCGKKVSNDARAQLLVTAQLAKDAAHSWAVISDGLQPAPNAPKAAIQSYVKSHMDGLADEAYALANFEAASSEGLHLNSIKALRATVESARVRVENFTLMRQFLVPADGHDTKTEFDAHALKLQRLAEAYEKLATFLPAEKKPEATGPPEGGGASTGKSI